MENYAASEWSPIDMLSRAWERALPHLPMLILASVGVFVVQFGVNMVVSVVEGVIVAGASIFAQQRGGDGAQLVVEIIRLVLQIGGSCITFPLTMATTAVLSRLGLSVARGEAPDFGAVSQVFSKIGTLILAGFLTGLAVALGMCFCIIPGIIVGIALQFVVFAVIDTDLGAIGALQYAWNIAKDHLVNLLIFGVDCFFVGVICVCGTCGIGLVVFQPLALVAQGLIYVHLTGRAHDFLPDPMV